MVKTTKSSVAKISNSPARNSATSKKVAKRAQRIEPKLKLIEEKIVSIDNRLFEVTCKLSSKVDFVWFHFPDKISGKDAIMGFHDLRFLPVVNEKFVFDSGTGSFGLIYLKDENETHYHNRCGLFKEKYTNKTMVVVDTYYELNERDYSDETMVDYHVFLANNVKL